MARMGSALDSTAMATLDRDAKRAIAPNNASDARSWKGCVRAAGQYCGTPTSYPYLRPWLHRQILSVEAPRPDRLHERYQGGCRGCKESAASDHAAPVQLAPGHWRELELGLWHMLALVELAYEQPLGYTARTAVESEIASAVEPNMAFARRDRPEGRQRRLNRPSRPESL